MAPPARPNHRLLVAVLLLVAGPAGGQDAGPFEATGEVRFRVTGGMTTSASYNATRVVGPSVNMTQREDGSWAGDLLAENLNLIVSGDEKSARVEGSFFTLVQRTSNGKAEIEGQFKGVRFRASVDAKRVKARFGDCSLDVEKKGTVFRGDVGCIVPGQSLPQTGRAVLDLMGDAVERIPFPQLGLALMAVLPQ
jgi:hypothetical protein